MPGAALGAGIFISPLAAPIRLPEPEHDLSSKLGLFGLRCEAGPLFA